MARLLVWVFLTCSTVFSQCLNFPPGVTPFSAISYVTAVNAAGDQLVVGTLAGGLNTLAALALPDATNEMYCDSAVQLAPGQYYSNVYVPSAAERSGNFSAFSGLLVNPANNQPFPGGVIPASQLTQVYAIRIGAAQVQLAAKGWSPTGSLPFQVTNSRAVRLPSGKVFVLSSFNAVAIYDPATGQFISTPTLLYSHGIQASVVLMADGRVLIVGGSSDLTDVEIYDPSTGASTAAGKTLLAHGAFNTATLLNDGRILLAGGYTALGLANASPPPIYSGAEIFDPKTGGFTLASAMSVNRYGHTAQLLQDGRVLITGGYASGSISNTTSAELFDPATNKFSPAGFMGTGRDRHFSVLLPNGTVLVGGGGSGSLELYDPVKNSFSYTGSLPFDSLQPRAVLLNNGQVLVFSGYENLTTLPATKSGYLYNPASGTVSPAASMSTPRVQPTATLLLDGRVLATGGTTGCTCIPSASYVTNSSAEIYTPTTQGLVTSQTGLIFRAAASASAVPSQTLAVLSPTDDIPWTASVKTYSGGNWLSATPAAARSTPGSQAITLTVTVDPAGLAAKDYYGAVTLTPTDQKHPPVTVAIVFSIVPAGAPAPLQVSPSGLVFLTQAGATPAPQTFRATTFTSRAVNFSATSTGTFFTFSPLGGTITAALSGAITVAPSTANLTAGVYRGLVRLSFNDGSAPQTVDVLMVVSSAPSGTSGPSVTVTREASTCTPTKLLPVLTTIAAGQTAAVAWPSHVEAQVVDDCQNTIDSGTVIASFTSGDAPIQLTNLGNGLWSGTWTPVHVSSNVLVRVDARIPQPPLSGTVQQPVQAAANPNVPLVAPGGVLSSGDYTSPPAAGLLVSIFGSALADGSAGFTKAPLPTQIGSTQVLLGGNPLPVVYVSDTQVNVLVPYETPLNTALSLIVTRANAISVPVKVAVFDAQPAILATAGNGLGQGHIYRATSSGGQVLADAKSPAGAGDVLVMYTVGMGAVTPAVKSGEASPSSTLARVSAPVTVTIGGQTATPQFAGLTPAFVGLYQVNVVMPSGVAAGGQTPVAVSVGAKSSPPGITMGTK